MKKAIFSKDKELHDSIKTPGKYRERQSDHNDVPVFAVQIFICVVHTRFANRSRPLSGFPSKLSRIAKNADASWIKAIIPVGGLPGTPPIHLVLNDYHFHKKYGQHAPVKLFSSNMNGTSMMRKFLCKKRAHYPAPRDLYVKRPSSAIGQNGKSWRGHTANLLNPQVG